MGLDGRGGFNPTQPRGECIIYRIVWPAIRQHRSITNVSHLLHFCYTDVNRTIKADQEKIRQVIQNLIDNAVKFTDKGYVKVTINQEPESVLITVSDTGRGMSKEMQKQAFERFTRDESVKKEIQGTGLGLYIAREIVSAHHGEIWAESGGEGQGSRFFVRLRKD